MTDLASLVVRLEAQTAQYDAKLEAANRKLTKFAKSSDDSLKKIKSQFAAFNKGLGLVGLGVSVAAVAVGFTRAISGAIEFGDEVNKAVAKTGVSAEAFSQLAYAAKQSDIEFEALGTAFKKMQQAVSQAASGSKQMRQIFSALRIDFDQFRKQNPDQQFEMIAEQISLIKDPADRTRAAVALFGKAGAELLPMFEQGAAGIRAAREEADKMGATLTGEQAKQLAEADDAIKRLGQAWDGVVRSLAIGVTPALVTTLDAMNNVLQKEPKVYSLAEAWAAVGRAFKKNGLGADYFDVIEEMKKGAEVTQRFSTGTRMAPGGHSRKRSQFDFVLPEDDDKAKAAAAKAAAEAERARTAALEKQADAYKAVYEAGMSTLEGLRTPAEEITARYEEQKFALEEMARVYPNLGAAAQAGIERAKAAADAELEALKKNDEAYKRHQDLVEAGQAVYEDTRTEVEKWANEIERLTMLFNEGVISQDTFTRAVEKANKELQSGDALTVFWEEAARNFQDLLADFLFDPFEDGIKGMLDSFLKMLQRMAAEAVAAQIGSKIFGAPTAGGALGGGLLDKALGWGSKLLGGIFGGSSGFGGFEDIAVTAQRMPVPFSGPRAAGGDVYPGYSYSVGEQGRAERFVPMVRGRIERIEPAAQNNNTFHFNVQTEDGHVSRATRQQLSAAVARGLAAANRRNN